jgi:DNA processing protein
MAELRDPPPEPALQVLEGSRLPHRLQDLPAPPQRLYLRGELPRGPAVAIVGTRRPSPEGRRFTRELAGALVAQGISVLSGGALGIDSSAHRGALGARGITVVVAPAGYRRAYPSENVRLFARVLRRGGAYVSHRNDGEVARKPQFFARNGILVALSHALVVVEASFRSGALNAASWARKLGRPLLVVPHAPWAAQGSGCLLELRRGARLCVRPSDVFDALAEALVIPEIVTTPSSPPPSSSGAVQQALPFPDQLKSDSECLDVLRAVRGGARHLDAVCDATGLAAASVQAHLLTLTLEGVLAPGPRGDLREQGTEPVSVYKRRKLLE